MQLRDGMIFRPSVTSSTSRVAHVGNIIPAGEISPAARALFAALPLPNLAGTQSNYEATGSFIQDRDSFDVKVNHNFSDTTTQDPQLAFDAPGKANYGQLLVVSAAIRKSSATLQAWAAQPRGL